MSVDEQESYNHQNQFSESDHIHLVRVFLDSQNPYIQFYHSMNDFYPRFII